MQKIMSTSSADWVLKAALRCTGGAGATLAWVVMLWLYPRKRPIPFIFKFWYFCGTTLIRLKCAENTTSSTIILLCTGLITAFHYKRCYREPTRHSRCESFDFSCNCCTALSNHFGVSEVLCLSYSVGILMCHCCLQKSKRNKIKSRCQPYTL